MVNITPRLIKRILEGLGLASVRVLINVVINSCPRASSPTPSWSLAMSRRTSAPALSFSSSRCPLFISIVIGDLHAAPLALHKAQDVLASLRNVNQDSSWPSLTPSRAFLVLTIGSGQGMLRASTVSLFIDLRLFVLIH